MNNNINNNGDRNMDQDFRVLGKPHRNQRNIGGKANIECCMISVLLCIRSFRSTSILAPQLRSTATTQNMKYALIISVMIIGYSWTTAAIFPSIQNSEHVKKDIAAPTHGNDDDKPDPPRNFTLEQLLQYDGAKDEKSNEDKPVYLSLNGIVFDVSKGRAFYGPGGPYEKVCHTKFVLPLSMLVSLIASSYSIPCFFENVSL